MTEEPIWGFTGGANFSYFIKKQFAISLGVNFSQKGYKIASMPTVDVNGTAGNAQIRYNYNYLEIPVKANFVLGKKKIRLLTSIGATSAFLLYEKTIRTIEYPDGTKSTTKDKPNYIYNPFNLFLTGSIGADFLLGKKMALRVEPSYSYGLLETIAVPFSEHLWSAGLNIGCYLYF